MLSPRSPVVVNTLLRSNSSARTSYILFTRYQLSSFSTSLSWLDKDAKAAPSSSPPPTDAPAKPQPPPPRPRRQQSPLKVWPFVAIFGLGTFAFTQIVKQREGSVDTNKLYVAPAGHK